MEKMQKLNLRMQKLDFPGNHWRELALIGAQKKPLIRIILIACVVRMYFLKRREKILNGSMRNHNLFFQEIHLMNLIAK